MRTTAQIRIMPPVDIRTNRYPATLIALDRQIDVVCRSFLPMDGADFDSLAHTPTTDSRRRALGGLVLGSLGLVGQPDRDAAAGGTRRGHHKNKNKHQNDPVNPHPCKGMGQDSLGSP